MSLKENGKFILQIQNKRSNFYALYRMVNRRLKLIGETMKNFFIKLFNKFRKSKNLKHSNVFHIPNGTKVPIMISNISKKEFLEMCKSKEVK